MIAILFALALRCAGAWSAPDASACVRVVETVDGPAVFACADLDATLVYLGEEAI